MRVLFLASIGLALSVPTAPQAQTFASQNPSGRAQAEAEAARQHVADWRSGSDKDCLAVPINEARYSLARISALVSASASSGTNDRLGRYERAIHLRRFEELSDLQVSTQLEIADAYLAENCLDDADFLYRDIIADFTGARHAGARQRALVGIDDIRSHRERESGQSRGSSDQRP